MSALIGLCFGSFLNVLIYRLNDEKAPRFWQGRSLCPRCKHLLAWKDNLPLVSYLFLGGKCRYCKKPIGWHYPIVEWLTALVAVVIFILLPHSTVTDFTMLLSYWVIAFSFIVSFFSDLFYSLIPDEMLIVGILGSRSVIASKAWQSVSFGNGLLRPAWTGLAMTIERNFFVGLLASLTLLIIVLFTRGRGLGLGDVKFAFVMGLLLGFPHVVIAFWLSFVFGGMVALVLLGLKLKKMTEAIPFGPFLILGTTLAIFFSDRILGILGI